MKYIERLFHNDNGKDYCILEGGIGQPSLLVDMHCAQYIVTGRLNNSDWNAGIYLSDIEEAISTYVSLYKKRP